MSFLKSLLGIGATVVVARASQLAKQAVDRELENFKRRREDLLLMYQLSRFVVICPECGSIHKIGSFEDQLKETWECACGCRWRETSSHDIVIIKGKK